MNTDKTPIKADRTDGQLLSAIALDRDKNAFEELFHRYSKSGFALAFRVLRSRPAAEEAVQEGMLQIWISASTFDPKGNAKGWIMRIIVRKCLLSMRGRKGKRMESLDIERDAAPVAPSHEIQVEAEDVKVRLQQEVGSLALADQQLVALYYGGGLRHREIGEKLGIPTRTVANRLSLIRDRLNQNLVKAGFASTGIVALLEAAVLEPELVPQDLWAGMSMKLEAAPHVEVMDKQSVRMGYGLGAISCIFVLAGTAAVVLALRQEGHPDSEASVEQVAETSMPTGRVDARPGVRPLQHKIWNFNSAEELKDFAKADGSFEFIAGRGIKKSGVLRVGRESTTVHINFKEFRLPIMVTTTFRPYQAAGKDFGPTIYWHATNFLASLRGAYAFRVDTEAFLTTRTYISDNGFDAWMGDTRKGYHFEPYEPKIGPQYLVFKGFNFELDALEVQEIEPADVPDSSNLRALIDRIPAKSPSGQLIISDMKPLPGYEQVVLNYTRVK